jgi:hypothetical protein
MFKPAKLLFLIAVGLLAWYFFTHFQLHGLENMRLAWRNATSGGANDSANRTGRKTIRIASVDLDPLDQNKLNAPGVAGRLALVLRDFDIVAVQGIRARDRSIAVQLTGQLNQEGRQYDFAVAPQIGRESVEDYVAFFFDTETIQIDRSTIAPVRDPDRRFRHPPLVALFRARGVPEREAFTFKLINVQTPADHAVVEVDALIDVFRAVRAQPDNEDDVILLGDLATDDQHLGRLGQIPYLMAVITGTATTMRGNRLTDNILFNSRDTIEYTARSGTVDLMRRFDITASEAEEISAHMPVWAEFSVYESGQPGEASLAP